MPDSPASLWSRLIEPAQTMLHASALRERLLARVRQSVLSHAQYRTVRREDSPWLPEPSGGTARLLRSDAQHRVDVLRLDDGMALAWLDGVQAQELLILDGALDAEPVALAYRVLSSPQQCTDLRARGVTTVYRRQLLAPLQTLPALEARWWQLPARDWRASARRRWIHSGPGVAVQALHGDADVMSMLVRFQPGASVRDHQHALDEDCLMLEGEMFLGDVLLRAGDFQLAPGGGSHFGERSDVGALFYFHGAIGPALRAPHGAMP